MLTLIVPYRDRPDHLGEFIKRLGQYRIVIVEQADAKPFNRGKLINAGFLIENPAIFIAHDVDMIGEKAVYQERPGINQLATSKIQHFDYLGGATMFTAESFPGYHNDYFHRAEDNELSFHLKRIRRYVKRWDYYFDYLPHDRTGPEFIRELWLKAQRPRTRDMLLTCKYEIISDRSFGNYRHLRVAL